MKTGSHTHFFSSLWFLLLCLNWISLWFVNYLCWALGLYTMNPSKQAKFGIENRAAKPNKPVASKGRADRRVLSDIGNLGCHAAKPSGDYEIRKSWKQNQLADKQVPRKFIMNLNNKSATTRASSMPLGPQRNKDVPDSAKAPSGKLPTDANVKLSIKHPSGSRIHHRPFITGIYCKSTSAPGRPPRSSNIDIVQSRSQNLSNARVCPPIAKGVARRVPVTDASKGKTRLQRAFTSTRTARSALPRPCCHKGNATHLLKEIECLKKLLAQKEATVEYQTGETDKWWSNYCRASEQNTELVKRNAQIDKELAFDREKLTLLQLEQKQMSTMYKAKIAELEHKVNGMSRQLEGMQECEHKDSGKKQDAQELQSKITSSSENSDMSTCKSGKLLNRANDSLKPDGATKEESSSDKRFQIPRQQEQSDASQTSSENGFCHISDDGLETLEKVSEDEVLDVTSFLRSEPTVQDHSTSGQFQDISASADSCKALENSFEIFLLYYMNILASNMKETRVKMEEHKLEGQENLAPPSGSSLNVDLDEIYGNSLCTFRLPIS